MGDSEESTEADESGQGPQRKQGVDLQYALKEELTELVMDRLEMGGEGERETKDDF